MCMHPPERRHVASRIPACRPKCSHVTAALTLRGKPERARMRPAGSCTCRCNSSRSSQNCCCRHRCHKASTVVATIHSRSHSLSGRSHSWRCCRTHRFRSGRKRYRDRQRSLDDRFPRRKDEEGQPPGGQEVRWDERDQRARRRRKDEEGQRRPQDPEDHPDQADQQHRRRACRDQEEVRQRDQEEGRREEGQEMAGPARRLARLMRRQAPR